MSTREWVTAEEIETVRQRIEAGQLVRARRAIKRWGASRIPRRSLATAARLARGVRLNLLALKWLHPVVRPRRGMSGATIPEKLEYLKALIAYGSYREAMSLLEQVDPSGHPDAGWTHALLKMRLWDWNAAIPMLEKVLADGGQKPFPRVQTRLNLAAALIHGAGDMRRARETLDAALAELPEGAGRIALDAAQLRAQSFLFEGKPGLAMKEVDRIRARIAPRGATFLHARVHEITEIAAYLEGGDGAKFRRKMGEVAERFVELGYFEFARAALYRAALWTGDGEALDRLYFGTPHEGFRRKLEAERRDGEKAPAEYQWTLGGAGRPRIAIDVLTGATSRPGTRLKAGQIPHRTLSALCSDLYRPLPIGELAQLIYPEDHIHPDHSALKVHQGLRRLKEWLDRQRIPLRIATVRGGYRLEADAPVALTLRREPRAEADAGLRVPAAALIRLEKLLLAKAKPAISLRDAIVAWRVSERSARRTLSSGVAAGFLIREGAGPGTRYRLR